ncbi:Uncharacterised protein [Actinomadura madurae]|nr:hypothetical protein [Actinomadura madurae]SPT57631.1 Uncharacterised protein [Actinomadura madurae]
MACAPGTFEDEEVRSVRQQARGLAGDDRAERARVVQHVGEPVGGVAEVERQVRGARFQDAEQGDDEVGRPRQRERDHAPGPGAPPAQLRRERGGARVQLRVGEGAGAGLDRRHVRGAGRLLLEQRDDVRLREGAVCGVGPLHQGAFPCVHDLERADGAVGVGERAGQERLQVGEQRVDARVVEQLAAERRLDRHALRPDEGLQRQVEVRRPVVDVRPAGRDPREVQLADLLGEEQQHRVEERRPSPPSRRAELLHDPVVRQRLVREALGDRPADPAQHLAERRRAGQVGAQHERVAEVPDEPLDLGVLAVHHRRPDRHVLGTGVAVQQHGVPGHHHHVRGEVLAGGEPPHPLGHRVVEQPRAAAAALGHDGAARMVGGQVERRGRRVEPCPPVREVVLGKGPALLPPGVVGVLDVQRRQPVRLAGHGRAVEGGQVPRQRAPGHAVPGDVVHDEDQRVLLVVEPEQLQPDRPLVAQRERRRREFRRPRLGVVARDRREAQGVVIGDDLDGAVLSLGIDRPEHGVPADQSTQRLPQRIGVERPRHAHEQADVVGRAVRKRTVVQPHALLRVGEGRRPVRASGGEPRDVRAEPGLRHHPPHQFASPCRRLLLLHAQLFRCRLRHRWLG